MIQTITPETQASDGSKRRRARQGGEARTPIFFFQAFLRYYILRIAKSIFRCNKKKLDRLLTVCIISTIAVYTPPILAVQQPSVYSRHPKATGD